MKSKFHYAYVVVFGAIILMIAESLVMGCANIFVTPISESLGVTVGTVGNHITIRSIGLFLWGIPVGKFLQKYDTRFTLSASILLIASCFFSYSFAQSIYVVYATSFFIAFSASILCMQIIPLLTNNWFAKNSAFWLGICAAAQGLFATVFQNIGSVIISAWDWRFCFRVFALIALATGLPISLFVVRKTPEEKGLRPVGYVESSSEKSPQSTGLTLAEAKRTLCFWLSVFIPAVISIGSVFNYYLTSYLRDIGMSTVTAGACSSILMIGMLVGKIFCGKLYTVSAKLGILCPLFGIVAFPLLLFAGTNTSLVSIACFLWGITYASCTITGAEICKYNFGLKEFSSIYAYACSLNGIGGAIGTALWSVTIDHISYQATILFALTAYIAAQIISIVSLSLGNRLRSKAWEAKSAQAGA